jgi:V8-like Glu-specific endopeptidase
MTTKIVIDHVKGSRLGQRQEFELVPRLRFGRHPENEIAFDPHRDLDASTRHAELRRDGETFALCDVGSSNGTYLDGVRITSHSVALGTPVEIEFGAGGPRCRIFVGEPREAPPPVLPTTMGELGKTSLAKPGGMGSRTVAMMVDQAVREAQSRHGLGRATSVMKSMVDQALHQSTLRFKMVIGTLSAVLVVVVVGMLYWNARLAGVAADERAAEVKRREDDRRVYEVQMQAVLEAKKREERLIAEGPGPRIVRENREAIFLFATRGADLSEKAFCTAFAVAEKHLATNSHCVAEINRATKANEKVFVVKNGDPSQRYDIAWAVTHPGYTGSRMQLSVDVALVEVTLPLPRRVTLATAEQLTALSGGTRMFTYGFPGRLADPNKPEATLTEGVIGRITRLSGEVGSFGENLLVQHSAFTTGGTSGSPVFDANGVVIALNAGGYVGQQKQVVFDPKTKKTKVVDVGASLAGYNYAIRIDALDELIRQKGVTVENGPKGAP